MTNVFTRFPAQLILTCSLITLLVSCGKSPETPGEGTQVPPPPSLGAKQGEPTTRVKLQTQQAQDLKIGTMTVAKSRFTYPIVAPGAVFPAPENVAVVSSPVNGRIAAIYAHEGASVSKGSVLCELESLEFSNLLAEYIQSRAEVDYQKNQLDRVKVLLEKKISPQSALDKTTSEYNRADAAFRAARSRILALGISEKDVEGWEDAKAINPLLKIRAPIRGSIAEHLIDLGQAVTSYQKLLMMINLSRVKIEGYVSPEEGFLIKPGDSLTITQKNFPARGLRGTVTSVNPMLDEKSKSLTVYVILPTTNGWPKPGENVRLTISATTPEPVIAVPTSAVVYDGDQPIVFVQKDSLTYERRPISILRDTEEMVVLRSGISEGEKVAISQLFTLKALSRFEQFAE